MMYKSVIVVTKEFNYGNVRKNNLMLSVCWDNMTHEQMSVIEIFISGRDVFVCLPTGFGKSLIFVSLPIIFNKIIKKSSV